MRVLRNSYSCVFAVVLLILFSNAFVKAQSVDPRFDEYMNAMAKLGRFNGYVLHRARWQNGIQQRLRLG